MTSLGSVYEFVYRGALTEEALDRAGRQSGHHLDESVAEIGAALSVELLDPGYVESARQMATVYMAITAFENSARRFVSRALLDAHGSKWWEKCVSQRIRNLAESRRDEEARTKWHGQRGENLLNYTEMGHLVDIIQQNWADFEPYVRRMDWARAVFGAVEQSRNVIMHSGVLEIEDIERVGMHIRDWLKQVGS